MNMRPEYPPEYDDDGQCDVCRRGIDGCDCEECPQCGTTGDVGCYMGPHAAPCAPDSIKAYIDHHGFDSTLRGTLRAIDKYDGYVCEFVVLLDGTRLYCDSTDSVHELGAPECTRLKSIGVAGIAWDGSDWEWSTETPAGDWKALDEAHEAFIEALSEHEAEVES